MVARMGSLLSVLSLGIQAALRPVVPPPWVPPLAVAAEALISATSLDEKQAGEFEDDDEVVVATADAADVVGAPLQADRRRRLDLALVEGDDLDDPVGHQAEDQLLLAALRVPKREFQHQDAGHLVGGLGRQAELQPQVDHRHAAAADIDQPGQIGRRFRNAEHRPHIQDLEHRIDRNREDLAVDAERHELRVMALRGTRHGVRPFRTRRRGCRRHPK
jgi:hypothetical protein